jgi:hypothetical protein
MDSADEPVDVSVLEALIDVRKQQELVDQLCQRAEDMKSAVTPAVYARVVADYAARRATLDREAAPLVTRALAEYRKLRALHGHVQQAHDAATLDKDEVEFRHSLGEIDAATRDTRLAGPLKALSESAAELAKLDAHDARFREALPDVDLSALEALPSEVEPVVEAPAAAPVAAAAATPDAAVVAASAEPDAVFEVDPIEASRALSDAALADADRLLAGAGAGFAEQTALARDKAVVEDESRPASERLTVLSGASAVRAAESPAVGEDSTVWLPDLPAPIPFPQRGSESSRPAVAAAASALAVAAVPPLPAIEDDAAPAGGGAALVSESDGGRSVNYQLSALTYIGRAEDNQIRILDPGISRRHVLITSTPDGYTIRDLKSQNGTYLNGERINETTLVDGDRITLGDVTLIFRRPSESAGDEPATDET